MNDRNQEMFKQSILVYTASVYDIIINHLTCRFKLALDFGALITYFLNFQQSHTIENIISIRSSFQIRTWTTHFKDSKAAWFY